MKITREEIEEWAEVGFASANTPEESDFVKGVKRLVLLGIQVEEGTAEAREVAEKIWDTCLEVGSFVKFERDQAAQLISLYTVGQGRKALSSDSREQGEGSERVGEPDSGASIQVERLTQALDQAVRLTRMEFILEGLGDILDQECIVFSTRHSQLNVEAEYYPELSAYLKSRSETQPSTSAEPLSDPTKKEDVSPSPGTETHPAAPHGDSLGEVVKTFSIEIKEYARFLSDYTKGNCTWRKGSVAEVVTIFPMTVRSWNQEHEVPDASIDLFKKPFDNLEQWVSDLDLSCFIEHDSDGSGISNEGIAHVTDELRKLVGPLLTTLTPSRESTPAGPGERENAQGAVGQEGGE